MLVFKSKVLTILVNIILGVWQILCWIPALIGLAIFRNCELYTNKEANITVLKVNKGWLFGGACFSLGPVIFVTPNCNENTIKHETGHSVQSLMFGFLFHFIVSIPSICLFWYRRIHKKDYKWYHSHFPENDADKRGHVKNIFINL